MFNVDERGSSSVSHYMLDRIVLLQQTSLHAVAADVRPTNDADVASALGAFTRVTSTAAVQLTIESGGTKTARASLVQLWRQNQPCMRRRLNTAASRNECVQKLSCNAIYAWL